MKRHHVLIGVVTTIVLLVTGLAYAQGTTPEREMETQAALGTGFTYQGQLGDGDGPVDGTCDLTFKLYDAAGSGTPPTGGTLLGTVDRPGQDIVEGLFTVQLDFGSGAFDGDARWLQVTVDCGQGAVTLSPRQALTPAPYAFYAPAAGSVPWSGLSGIPADIADGDDDTTYSAGAGLQLTGSEFSADFAGTGSADTIARSDHNHLSETWTGSDNSLVITGTFSQLPYAPLVLGNTSGHGLVVDSAGWHGVHVDSADYNGLRVHSAGLNGVSVGSAGFDGVAVNSAGDDGVYVNSAGDDGFQVDEATYAGLRIAQSGSTGVVVEDAGDHGLFVGTTGVDGVFVNNPGGYAGYFNGDVNITGSLSKAGGTFKIDHPLDPENKYLNHSFVESPDMMNIYNGNVTTDDDGYATVMLPDYFEALNEDFRYQLTVIGTFAQAIIAEEVEDGQFVIQTDEPNVKVSWQVTGIRKDPYAQANRIVVEEEKPPEEQGTYLHPELYGQPESRGLTHLRAQEQSSTSSEVGENGQ